MWSESLLLLPPSLLPLSNPASSSPSRPHLTETTVTSDVPTLAPRDHLEQLSGGELVIHLLLALHVFYFEVLHNGIDVILKDLLAFHDSSFHISARHFDQNSSQSRVPRSRSRFLFVALSDSLLDVHLHIHTLGPYLGKSLPNILHLPSSTYRKR